MWKKLLSIVLLISFFSFSFCFAFDVGSIKNDWLPKIKEWWGNTVNWINNDLKPWIGKNLGESTRKEFEKEFSEAIRDIPVTIASIWNKALDLIK